MNVEKILWDAAGSTEVKAMPILSFPASQILNVSVNELVEDARLQASAMATIASHTATVAAVSLMDLSVEAEAFGADVRFFHDEVPAVVGQLISDADQADRLMIPSLDQGRIPVYLEAIRLAKEQIQDKPVLAGMIGPYSLAGRLMDVTEIMYICYDEPELVHQVLDKCTSFLIQYGKALQKAGADGMIIAEPLAGILSPDLAAEFSMPYVKKIVSAIQSNTFKIIYHNCGNAVQSMLEDIFSIGAAGYHFGNAANMKDILDKAPKDVICMGNIDPASEFVRGTVGSITKATKELLNTCGSYPNFVISSGCDIPAQASWDNIHAFFAALNE